MDSEAYYAAAAGRDPEHTMREQELARQQQTDDDFARKQYIIDSVMPTMIYEAVANLHAHGYNVNPKGLVSPRWVRVNGEDRVGWKLMFGYNDTLSIENYTCLLADGTIVQGEDGEAHEVDVKSFTHIEAIAVIESLRAIIAYPEDVMTFDREWRNWLFVNGFIKSRNPYG